MKKFALPVLLLVAAFASADLTPVPHVIEREGKFLGLVFNVTGGQQTLDPATGGFRPSPVEMLCSDSPVLLSNLLPRKYAEFAQVDVDKEVYRQDFGPNQQVRHRMTSSVTKTVTLPASDAPSKDTGFLKVTMQPTESIIETFIPQAAVRTKEGLYVLDGTTIGINNEVLPGASVSQIVLRSKEDQKNVKALDGNPQARVGLPLGVSPKIQVGDVITFRVIYKGKSGTLLQFRAVAQVLSVAPADLLLPTTSPTQIGLDFLDWTLEAGVVG